MDHKWLEDFLVLARERSFSRAAQQRHVTQPQFSRRIRALELWAGTDLVNRSAVPLTLTPAGEELLPIARRAVTSLEDSRERIRQSMQLGDWVTLVTGRTLSRTAVPGWSASVRRAVGDFKLRLVTCALHEGVAMLEQGGGDFMLSFWHPRLELQVDDRLFEGVTIGSDELVAVSAPRPTGGPLHALPGTPRSPVPVLAYAPTLALNRILQDALARKGEDLHLSTVLEADFAESLLEQAIGGAGAAWLPRALVANDLRERRLAYAEATPQPIRFEFRLMRPRTPRNELVDHIWRASAPG